MSALRVRFRLNLFLIVGFFLAGAASTVRAQVPPANDSFAAAEVLPNLAEATSVPIDTSNNQATAEPTELTNPALELTRAHGSLWWRWTPPVLSQVSFTLHNSQCNTVAGVFTGDSLENLVPVLPVAPSSLGGSETPGVDQAGWIQFRARPGVTYYFAAGGFDNGTGPTRGRIKGFFQYSPTPGLSNDFFADRIAITGREVVVTGAANGAGLEPDEPSGQFGLYESLWWSYTAPEDGAVRISYSGLNGQPWPVVLGFSGESLATLNRRAIDTDVMLKAGETLHLAAGGFHPFELKIRFVTLRPPSTNDAFASRPDLPLVPTEILGNLQGSTAEEGEPVVFPVQGGTLWWGLQPPVDGILEFAVSAENFGPYPHLFSGNVLNSLTGPLAWAGPFGGAWRLTAGQPYALRLGASYGEPSEFRMVTQFFGRPTNDVFASRIRIETNDFSIHSWIFDASMESGEPVPVAGTGQTLWWTWAAAEDGRLEALDSSPDGNPLALYSGPDLTHLSRVPFREFTRGIDGGMAAPVRAGVVYHLQAGAPAGATLPVKLGFRFRPYGPALADAFAQPHDLEGDFVRSIESIVGATRELGEPQHLGRPDGGSIWWRWTAPRTGRLQVTPEGGTATGVGFALYQGPSVEALQRLTSGTGALSWSVNAGEIYYLAADAAPGTIGDVGFTLGMSSTSSATRTVPGNLVKNPSFEVLDENSAFRDWIAPQGLSGYVGAPSTEPSADGNNFVILSRNPISQILPTQPGQRYRMRLTVAGSDEKGEARVELRIAGELKEVIAFPVGIEPRFWRWRDLEFTALSDATEMEIRNAGVRVGLDAVSVVWMNEPPRMVQPPAGITTFAGSPVALVAGVRGSGPLEFKWYRDEEWINRSSGPILQWDAVQLSDSGRYRLVVRNPWGEASSPPVELKVEPALSPQIVSQPSGVSAVPGQFVSLSVAAVGTPPLRYQWYREGELLTGRTNRTLTLPAVSDGEFGTYHVVVRNGSESVTSLPAPVVRAAGVPLGGTRVAFAAWLPNLARAVDLTVYDLDGFTPLASDHYVAQLYAGPTAETLRAVGLPRPFMTGFYQGYWEPEMLTLPHVPAMAPFVLQVRAWDARVGDSYEEARALGGRFGRSDLLARDGVDIEMGQVSELSGLSSFSLTAGLPEFTVGRIGLDSQRPDGTPVWRLEGAKGFRYLLEKQEDGENWKPVTVFEDFPGTTTFETPVGGGSTVLFRARILD